mgnify:CR=1 FL=1
MEIRSKHVLQRTGYAKVALKRWEGKPPGAFCHSKVNPLQDRPHEHTIREKPFFRPVRKQADEAVLNI